MSGALATLQNYLDDLRDLVHDPLDQYWGVPQKTAYINKAVKRRDLDTGQNRVLFNFTTTIGTDLYSFADLVTQNPQPPIGPSVVTQGATSIVVPLSPVQVAGYSVSVTANWTTTTTVSAAVAGSFTVTFGTAAPAGAILYWQLVGGSTKYNADQVFDVIGINLLYSGIRVVMQQFSFTELNVYLRQYVPTLRWAPVGWARYSPNQIFFGPAPSIAYVTEWDCSTISHDLVNVTDSDLMPLPYSNPVKYYAAYLGKMNERQYDEAKMFLEQYQSDTLVATNSRAGMVPNMYSSAVTRI